MLKPPAFFSDIGICDEVQRGVGLSAIEIMPLKSWWLEEIFTLDLKFLPHCKYELTLMINLTCNTKSTWNIQ